MSGRNGSASDADCRISEDCPVPDVELMELGPLLVQGGGRQVASKGGHPEVEQFYRGPQKMYYFSVTVVSCDPFEGSCNAR